MTSLDRWWRIFWASLLMLLVAAQPALADVLDLNLDDALSCTGGVAGTGATLFKGRGGAVGCHSPDMGFVSSFLCMFETTLGMIIAAFFCKLAEAWLEPLGALILLFMFTSGIAFITGIMRMTTRDFALVLFKIGLVATFALNTEIALQIAFKLFISIIKESVEIFTDVFGASASLASRDNMASAATGGAPDPVITVSTGEDMGCGPSLLNFAMAGFALAAILVLLIFFAPILCGLIIMAFLSVLAFVAQAAFGYLYALVMLTFLVAAMPIFVSFALFSPTRQLFTSWLAYIFSNIIQIMIVYAFLGFAMYVDWFKLIRDLGTLLVMDTWAPFTWDYWKIFSFDYCTICKPNITYIDDIPEIAAMPNQCVIEGGKVKKISVLDFPQMAELMYLIAIKAASLYLLGEVLANLMKDVPEMSKLLGGSSPMMMISGTPRSGHADGQRAMKIPGLSGALENMTATARNNFTYAGQRQTGGANNMFGYIANRNKRKNLFAGVKDIGRSAIYGKSSLSRKMVLDLKRYANFKTTEIENKVNGLTTKSTALSKKLIDLTRQKERLEAKGGELKKSFEEKQTVYRATVDKVMSKMGDKETREKLEKQYNAMETREKAAVKHAYNSFSDANKMEKDSVQVTQSVEQALQILDSLKPGESLTPAQATEIHRLLQGVNSTGMEITAKLLNANNNTAAQTNDNFLRSATRAKDFAAGFMGKKKINAKDTDLLKRSLTNMKLAHAETAIQLRRHFESTQEKYMGATMERDRHKADWLFEQMAAHNQHTDQKSLTDMDEQMIRARNEVMIAKKQMDVHKYDLQKNEAELGSTRTSFTTQEKALSQAEAEREAMQNEFNSSSYLRGRTKTSRDYLYNKYEVIPDSRTGLLDEILDPDDQYNRFFGEKKKNRQRSWVSMMHRSDG